MRVFPNMTVMAPGDESDLVGMLEFALRHEGPTSLRYPKTAAERIERTLQPIEHGRAEVLDWGARLHVDRLRHGAGRLRSRGRSAS